MASRNLPYERLGLAPTQERFCLAVLQTESIAEACRRVKIKAATGGKWMREPAIIARIKQARKAAFDQAISQIQGACTEAVRVLRLAMLDPKVVWSVRVRAADCILTHALGASVIEELSEKISALEAIVYSEQPGQRRAG
jgi:hypothetical protein